jgi:hypothetical protein
MDNKPINVGDCFLFSNDEGGTHLHIVIADDHDDPYGQVIRGVIGVCPGIGAELSLDKRSKI